MKIPLSLLIVEDSEDDAELLLREVKRGGYEPNWLRVDTAEGMQQALDSREWDVVVADYAMPGFSGLEAHTILQKSGMDLPFILVSGTIGEETAVAAMKAGAHDYIMKDNLRRLVPAIERELRDAAVRKEHRATETALRKSEHRYRALFENTREAIVASDRDGIIVSANPAAAQMLGFDTPEKLIGMAAVDLYADPAEREKTFKELKDKGYTEHLEATLINQRTGMPVHIMGSAVLTKDNESVVRRAEFIFTDITERKRVEEEATRLGRILEDSLNEIYIFNAESLKFVQVNRGALQNLGYGMDEMNDLTPMAIEPEFTRDSFNKLLDPLRTGVKRKIHFSTLHKRKDGSTYPVEVHLQMSGVAGSAVFVAIVLDITERRHLEEQLQQSQKMEAVGRLAGGIAHDFNNLLTVILGNAEFAAQDCNLSSSVREEILRIKKAATQARDVTRQLLTFSRNQVFESKLLDMNVVIEEHVKLLKRVIGEDIELKTNLQPDIPPVWSDQTQIQQVLMNLSVNARDAMPKGGKLTIETCLYLGEETFLAEQTIRLNRDSSDEAARRFVKITVTDSGVGMDQQTRSRIFEPFFTTKEVGKGTGLGLAVVYGIVKQHKGVIQVSSKLKQGTAFEIYFPAVSKTEKAKLEKTAAQPMVGGKELVLVVEDESAVRNVSIRILRGLGYRVLAAHDGNAALKIFADEPAIDLVIVDVVMPGQSGPDTYKKMIKKKANLPAVFVTGYDVQSEISGIAELNGERIALLQKPYTRESLGKKVREVLDQAGSGKK